jgi:Domain of unknown function (DUF4178)
MRNAFCPSCGAPVKFQWSSAVQTTCPYCRSILVRHDVNLEAVGKVADLPADPSPIQIGTEGVFRGRSFRVIGRILYTYELGGWNEWHLLLNDGSSGWLSDASLEYAVSFLRPLDVPVPAGHNLQRGWSVQLDNIAFQVTTITRARYAGVEGELPFEYWGKEELIFADLRSADARFATLDYSEQPPLLFLGEAIEFEDLRLQNLKHIEGWS